MVWTVPISSKGQITLPSLVRLKLGVSAGGDKVLIQEEDGNFLVKRVAMGNIMDLFGIAKVVGGNAKNLISEAKRARAVTIAQEGLK